MVMNVIFGIESHVIFLFVSLPCVWYNAPLYKTLKELNVIPSTELIPTEVTQSVVFTGTLLDSVAQTLGVPLEKESEYSKDLAYILYKYLRGEPVRADFLLKPAPACRKHPQIYKAIHSSTRVVSGEVFGILLAQSGEGMQKEMGGGKGKRGVYPPARHPPHHRPIPMVRLEARQSLQISVTQSGRKIPHCNRLAASRRRNE